MRFNRTVILAVPILAFGLLSGGITSTAAAAPVNQVAIAEARSGARDAKAMLDHAVSYLNDNSPERAFAAFNNQNGSFYRNDLYTFVVGIEDGIMHAHGGAPEAIVGSDVRELRDAAGKLIIKEMLAAANQPGGGTVNYVWLNRVTNRVEDKTSLVRKVGKYMVGVGYYVPRSSAQQAEALLDIAVAEARKSLNAAFAAFNDPKGPYVREDLYVFAVSLDDARFVAMGVNPALVGTDVGAMKDAAGKPIIAEMIALARNKGSGTVDYVWRNPVTNKIENKHSRIERLDNYLIGVGYYTR
ncbi:MAG: chemotaxis protein [Betaproteobacteria bacterium]|nr:chemotaxis protein [Betaproteobacteria bacterium]